MEDLVLVKAAECDAENILDMQKKAFASIYERYHDDDTSPVFQTLERMTEKIVSSDFYIIYREGTAAGAVDVCTDREDKGVLWISPIFLLPEYQDKGTGTAVMELVFAKYPDVLKWKLSTIKQEELNCHFYEKLGFVRVGDEETVNDLMTLVFYEKTV